MIKSTKKPCYLADSSQLQFQNKKCNKATKAEYSVTKRQKKKFNQVSYNLHFYESLVGPDLKQRGGEKGEKTFRKSVYPKASAKSYLLLCFTEHFQYDFAHIY